ncbi:hypothetical protein NC652_024066 [Populus alba x Populus x berolinensis]|nr:hypothetical protein NC652_024066 [Populus alba x Populus x berolinensis]
MDQNPTPSSIERGVEVLKRRRERKGDWKWQIGQVQGGLPPHNASSTKSNKKSASPTARVYLSQFSSTIRLPNLTLHCHSAFPPLLLLALYPNSQAKSAPPLKVDLLIISVPSSASACSGKERIVERQSVFSKTEIKFS